MDEIVFEKSWRKMKERMKTFTNFYYKAEKKISIDVLNETFKSRFNKKILPLLYSNSISSQKEKQICKIISDFSFIEPHSFPHDSNDIYIGIGYFIFAVLAIAMNYSEWGNDSFTMWLSIIAAIFCVIFGFRYLCKKSIGLAYANQLDSIYHEIKRILAE